MRDAAATLASSLLLTTRTAPEAAPVDELREAAKQVLADPKNLDALVALERAVYVRDRQDGPRGVREAMACALRIDGSLGSGVLIPGVAYRVTEVREHWEPTGVEDAPPVVTTVIVFHPIEAEAAAGPRDLHRHSSSDTPHRYDPAYCADWAAAGPRDEGLDGRTVHAAWRDGMLAQGREVAPERMAWETLTQQDRELDEGIAARLRDAAKE